MSQLDLEIRQLRALVAFVEHGSVTAAAQSLGVAQSTLSEALASLERSLGAPVVLRRRGSRGIRLTSAGKALLPHARSAIAAVEQGRHAAASMSRQVRTTVDVAANESVSTYLLPPVLSALRPQWPNTRFAVTVAACGDVFRGVADGTYDVGLHLESAESEPGTVAREQAITPAAFHVQPVMDVPLVVFCSPDHPLTAMHLAPNVSPATLSTYPIFVSEGAGRCYERLATFLNNDSAVAPRLEPTGSIEGVKRNVASHRLALGVLPFYAVSDELQSGDLRVISTRISLPSLRLDAVLTRGNAEHPAALELVQRLRGAKPAGALAS